MHLVFDYLGYPRFDPGSPGFIALSVVQLLIMGAGCMVSSVAPLENNRCREWRPLHAGRPEPGGRRAAVRCRSGHARRSAGAQGPGFYCVAVMLIALVAARGLASDAQRVCAASLPARMT